MGRPSELSSSRTIVITPFASRELRQHPEIAEHAESPLPTCAIYLLQKIFLSIFPTSPFPDHISVPLNKPYLVEKHLPPTSSLPCSEINPKQSADFNLHYHRSSSENCLISEIL
ncbi:hypothetical protein BS78_04G181900 [Paspalum vaginatum]|nr:hypothetical protein BS78_04G181900 [Paspalum vaginatum]